MRENLQKLTFGAVVLFLCCYFMRLFAFPNIPTVGIGAGLCFVLLIQQECIRIDIGTCLLAVTMFSYYVIVNGIRGLFFMLIPWCILP